MQFQGVRIKQAVGLKGSDCASDSDPYFVARIGLSGTSWENKSLMSGGHEFRSKTGSFYI